MASVITEEPRIGIDLLTERECRHSPPSTRFTHEACPNRIKKDVRQGVAKRIRIPWVCDETGLPVDDKLRRGSVAGSDNRSAVQHRTQGHQVEGIGVN